MGPLSLHHRFEETILALSRKRVSFVLAFLLPQQFLGGVGVQTFAGIGDFECPLDILGIEAKVIDHAAERTVNGILNVRTGRRRCEASPETWTPRRWHRRSGCQRARAGMAEIVERGLGDRWWCIKIIQRSSVAQGDCWNCQFQWAPSGLGPVEFVKNGAEFRHRPLVRKGSNRVTLVPCVSSQTAGSKLFLEQSPTVEGFWLRLCPRLEACRSLHALLLIIDP